MSVLPDRLLISVHDVMPDSLPAVRDVLSRLEGAGRTPATLLVVPGRCWSAMEIEELRHWRDRGHELAAHGWSHRAIHVRGSWHRLHAVALSRNVAEHLALGPRRIVDLIRRSRAWFGMHDLGAPSLYVPPAWAMGSIRRPDIRRLGFRYFETVSGFYDARDDIYRRVPLSGFEADTPLRAAFLRIFNRCNLYFGRQVGWLRVAIHPRDLGLRLGKDLHTLLGERGGRPARVAELFNAEKSQVRPGSHATPSDRPRQASNATTRRS